MKSTSLTSMDVGHLRKVPEAMVALPTLPLVASRLLESIADPEAASSEEIGAVIALDPALTARTLKLANSDFYGDRKSTRLNSSHEWISYAVFCLKKKHKVINT